VAAKFFAEGDPEALHGEAFLPEEWQDWLEQVKERGFRAKQIFRWIHGRGVLDPAGMTDLPASLRQRLVEAGLGPVAKIAHEHTSPDGTTKIVVQLKDGASIESVLIPMRPAHESDADAGAADDDEDDEDEEQGAEPLERVTQCISTQVGCAMKCAFCASGVPGLRRQLFPEEIEAQALLGRALLNPGQKLRNIVFMGSGEPLHNYDALARAIRLMTHKDGLALPRRRITVSTVGLTEGIERLGRDFDGRVGLAISLHAADDATRSKIVPANKRWSLDKIVAAMRAFPLPPHRKITVEYALIDGVNDGDGDARQLASLLRGVRVKVNLIPMNPVDHAGFQPPSQQRVLSFQRVLQDGGYTCLIRRRRGDDVSAACGQLVTRLEKKPATSD